MKFLFFIFALTPLTANAQFAVQCGVPITCPLPHYGVTLTWDAPIVSPDPVVSYDAFRAPSGQSAYAQLNTTAVLSTSYVDTTVQLNNTYNYMVESVDANGVTSGPSNVVTVVIPVLGPTGTLKGSTN
jgi:hypothetical protein